MRDEATEGHGDSTLAYPEQLDTVDVVAGRIRAARVDAPEARAADPPPDRNAPAYAGTTIGRYQLLKPVGAGAMGLVWGAWDPELERRVALKLVRTVARESRARMLREGQLLAQLSHPNVVPIYDVGELGDQVFLVLEWVHGITLRSHAARASGLPAVLDAYRQAGRGLAAAHAAGLIHRDFKPDNAIVGDDGRIRVLDFGLAHAEEDVLGPASRRAGTPHYMAPEQVRGEQVTAAADQFAFCVALREALEARGPVPAWLAAVVGRGMRAEVAERFATMSELLDALDRDPVRRRRRGALVAVAAATVIGAFAIGRTGRSPVAPAIEPCSGGRDGLSAAWSDAVREQLTEHLRGLGKIPAEDSGAITTRIHTVAEAWLDQYGSSCRAAERKELTPQRYEAWGSCLRRARSQLSSVVELLGHAQRNAEVMTGLRALDAMSDVRRCEYADPVDPPASAVAERVNAISERVERTWVRIAAKEPDAVDESRALTRDATETGYQPLIARARLVEGWAALQSDDPAALDALGAAWQIALATRDEALAVEAYARWLYASVRFPQSQSVPPLAATTQTMWPMMSVIAERLGAESRFARALLYNNAALLPLVAGDKRAAIDLLERAQRTADGDPSPELLAIRENLARLQPDPEDCERLMREVFDARQTLQGWTHRDTFFAQLNVALVTRDRSVARALFDTACSGLHGRGQVGDYPLCAYEAAWFADEDGDPAAARVWMTDAVAFGKGKGGIAAAYLAIGRGDHVREARADLERIVRESSGVAVSRVIAADALVVLAHAAEQAGEDRTAIDRAWERAYAMLENVDYAQYGRRKARLRATIAERWQMSRPAKARELAGQALRWYRDQPGDELLVQRLERIVGPPVPLTRPARVSSAGGAACAR